MGKMTFQKLDQKKGKVGAPFEVQFNPTEYGLSKSARFADVTIPGLDSPVLQFVHGESEKLSLELFFDSTDEGGTGSDAKSVTTHMDAFYRLVKVDGETHAPPLVRVTWGDEFPGHTTDQGAKPVPIFDAVVESVDRKYTLFNSDGVPLRATVSLSLREFKTIEEQLQTTNPQSSDHTRVHVVKQGEMLPQIAYEAYEDPAAWRVIAAYNKLLNPRDIQSGMLLHLPPIS